MSLSSLTDRSWSGHAGIDLGHGAQRLGAPPEQPEAVQLAVVGHVAQQPLEAVGHRLVVVRDREVPVRGALEDLERRHLLGDDRRELGGAAPGADHADALAGEVDAVVPLGRVERRAGEAVAAFDVRQLRAVELADGADHGVGLQAVLFAVGADQLERPRGRRRRRTPRRRPRCRSGCCRGCRTRRRTCGSTGAAPRAASRRTASRRAARTSSCSSGSGCRRGSPG